MKGLGFRKRIVQGVGLISLPFILAIVWALANGFFYVAGSIVFVILLVACVSAGVAILWKDLP